MNRTDLIGNLVREPELRKTQTGKAVCSFTLAVYRDKEHTDFINCVAWNKSAELMNTYCKKGDKIGVSGSIQVRNYDNQQGQRVYVTEVLVDRIDLLTPREPMTVQNTQSSTNMYGTQQTPYMKPKYDYGQSLTEMAETDEITSDDLPFNVL